MYQYDAPAAPPPTPTSDTVSFNAIYGVDFSGARLAGRHAWLARIERDARDDAPAPYKLTRLARLDALCGVPEREPVLAHLVSQIAASHSALWALGFPFGLPLEVQPEAATGGWPAQVGFLHEWGDDAYGAGVECLRRAQALGHKGHIRRLTDVETRAPWDTYSYRIIYQTFYGMRDVLGALWGTEGTAILPFDYARLARSARVLVEACPSSTLRRLGLPHTGYKRAGAGALASSHRRARREILAGLASHVSVGRTRRRLVMLDPAGDALDALVAAVGAALSWPETDHGRVAGHPRYVCEGRQYV